MEQLGPPVSGFPFVLYSYFLNKTIDLWNMYNATADGTSMVVPGGYGDGTLAACKTIMDRRTSEAVAKPMQFDQSMAVAERKGVVIDLSLGDGSVDSMTAILRSRSQDAFRQTSGNLINIVV